MRQGSADENCCWRQVCLCAVGQDTPLEEGEQPTVGVGLVPWFDVDDIYFFDYFYDYFYDG